MRASVTVRAGSFTVAADLAVAPGEVVAVVGPNGAGKTTLLRGLAGLAPATGSVVVAHRELTGVPPERRRVGWVGQGAALLPHLTAAGNVGYGLPRAGRRDAVRGALAALGVEDLAGRRPSALSGGQAARVALARALVRRPDLVLLDEPMAALDAQTRTEVRQVLRSALAGGPAPALVVTHDPVDALAVADRVVVLEAGRVVQDASVGEVARRPATTWAARLMGLNAWEGVSDGEALVVGGARVLPADPLPDGQAGLALLAPSAVALHRVEPEGSARNRWSGPVVGVTSLGGRVRVELGGALPLVAEVTPAAAAELGLADGGVLWASAKAVEVGVVPRPR
jgi:molybdopterin-binding protein